MALLAGTTVLAGCLGSDDGDEPDEGGRSSDERDDDRNCSAGEIVDLYEDQTGSLPGPVTGEWTVAGGDVANTGFRPGERVPHEPPAVAWRTYYEGVVGTSPVVADGAVYVGDRITRLDARDGGIAWSHTTETIGTAPPVLHEGTVLVPSADGSVYAFERDGSERWTRPTGVALHRAPIVVDGTLVVAEVWDGWVYGLDAATGEVRFERGLDGRVVAGAVSDGERCYLPTEAGTLHCLSLDGEDEWAREFDAPLTSRAAIGYGLVLVGDEDGTLHALDLAGEPRWNVELDDRIAAPPAITDDDVVVGTTGGTLAALDRDGEERWQETLEREIHDGPVVTEESILVPGRYESSIRSRPSRLYCLSRAGERRWIGAGSVAYPGRPAVVDGVIFWSVGGTLFAITTDDEC